MAELKALVDYRLELASSPHIHTELSTAKSMQWVVIALLPAVISAIVVFGVYQLVIIATTVIFAVLTEYAIKKMRKQAVSIKDSSAILTGLLLGLILPPNFSPILAALGSVIAIGLGKEVFGGLGYNMFNPALVGRAFLQAAFPIQMTTWTMPTIGVDAVTSATPLGGFKFDGVSADLATMLFGNTGGCLGETSVIAIAIGAVILMWKKIMNWRIPLAMIIGVVVFGGLLWLLQIEGFNTPTPLYHILGGGFMFGAIFMATDWVTSPITQKGIWIFGLGIALILVVIRVFGGLPEGVMYAILFMNAFVPLINKYTKPRIFGESK